MSLANAWLYVHIAYSFNGIYAESDMQEETGSLIFVTCMPIINTFWSIFSWILIWPWKTNANINLGKHFFQIKKFK